MMETNTNLSVTADTCGCRKCLDDRNATVMIGDFEWPEALTRMIVCPICGDKRCVHAYTHEAPCAKADLYAHNAWVEQQLFFAMGDRYHHCTGGREIMAPERVQAVQSVSCIYCTENLEPDEHLDHWNEVAYE